MRPIVLQEIRLFDVVEQQPAAPAWAHQHWGGQRLGPSHACWQVLPETPRRVKHPPVKFDKGVAVDRLA